MTQLTTPTFIIGLGGIGNIVARLVWERYTAAGELPSTVRIRSIDTAGQSEHEFARPLPDSMFTRLGGFQANEVVQHLQLFPDVQRWWKYPPQAFSPGFIDNGAGARRPVGRLIFFREFAKVLEAIRSDLSGPKSDVVQRELVEAGLGKVSLAPRVFIIGSLAGGTGAGTFLDVAFLTRYLFQQLGYQRSSGTITGIFGMPSVIHLASGDPDSTQARERQVNAIGALSELDYLIGGWPSGQLTLQYPQPIGRFEPQPPLFNQVYLFTDRRLKGVTFTRQADVLQRVAHFVFGQIALGMGEKTLDIVDNYKKYFDPAQQRAADGLGAVYCSFGVEWLEVPHDRLMTAWYKEIGETIATRVADLQWGQETKRNLDKVVRDRLSGKHEAYRIATDVADSSPDTLLTLRGIPDVQVFLGNIQGAKNKGELEDAVNAFDTQLPGLLDSLRKQKRALPTREEDQQWARSLGADLLASKEFRAGGARRTLEAAAALLGRISEPVTSIESAAEVLKRCGGGWFSRLDTTPALDWARRRVAQQARQVVKTEFGGRAAELSSLCTTLAELLTSLQQAVRSEARSVDQKPQRAWSPPADSWMLDDRDIAESIAQNREAVIDLVAGAISEALAGDIREGRVPGSEARSFFEQRFSEMALEAIERESMRLTRRPDDMLRRIKNRVEMCEPMAHIIDDGPEFLKTMSAANRATPLKIVLTTMADDQRAELENWAKEQRAIAGDQNAFQIAASTDYSRDDALYLTFGWPLWLFNEVRNCQQATDVTRDTAVNTVISSRVLGELPLAANHEIRPMQGDRSDLLFGYAVVLGFVKPVHANRTVFQGDVFPGQPDTSSLTAAYEQFRRGGLNRSFESLLKNWQMDGRAFKARVGDALAMLRRGLDGGEIPSALAGDIRRYIQLVELDSQQIVGL
jgi:hypothetical protein